MSTAAIFAPDGTVRQIPQDSLQDALSAGGKRAALMTDPTGTLRYVPEDQVPQAMQSGGKMYQPSGAPNTLGDMADVALQGLKGIAQLSAPGIAASLINKTAPGIAAKLQQVPYIGPMMQQAAPLNQIPGMATAAMASPLAEGMATGDLVPDPNAPRPQPAPPSPASPNGSSLLKIMSRHIPVIGRGLRAMDTVGQLQDLVNGPAPAAPAPPGPPAPAPPTGPAALWGKYATPELGQATSLGQIPPTGALPASQTGEALGQIPQPQTAPQTPNVQPVPQVTPAQPAAMLQFEPVANSSQLAGHTYDPQTQTATMQFKNGQIHQYFGVTPEDWSNYRNQSSPGKGFQTYIKRDPATGAGRTSRPLTATSAQSAATAQEAQPTTANELLERYIGIF
jgi:hypothetical protein